ncbi:uncharacterized protein L201_004521 [Kwoniella dendrophila CBS 6074]|uniref:Wax synthase domain-containing protein n=1 Tax=Kwoniella dendrophila CBS 6074 TaxID=1295534 RepID=A0AAX4JW33_9TREE
MWAFNAPPEYHDLPDNPPFPKLRCTKGWKVFDLMCNYRLLNLSHKPPINESSSKSSANKISYWSGIKYHTLQLLYSIILLDIFTWPSIKTPLLFPELTYEELTITLKEKYGIYGYLVDVVMVTCQGLSTYQFICIIYHFEALLGIGLKLWLPEEFPKLMHRPDKADNLNDLWGNRWHQLLRKTNKFYLSKIPFNLPKPLYMVVFFLLSGLGHCPFYYIITGKFHTLLFLWTFGLLGLGCILERQFYHSTNFKVGGYLGKIWMWNWLILSGEALTVELYNLQVDLTRSHPLPNGDISKDVQGSLTDLIWRTLVGYWL